MTPLQQALLQLLDGQPLDQSLMHAAIGAIMEGEAEPVQISALLMGLRIKGEEVEEIAGAAQAMRERVTRIKPAATGLLDTCGTGGDGLNTFNISTATAILAAACGVNIAKHGNRSVSSSSGSSNVLETLGVNLQLSPASVATCVDEIGIGFCFAPLLHQAMKYVAPVRQQLGIRTIFNLLGPLTNPAGAEYQLLGTNSNEHARKIAHALARLGTHKAAVICGNDEIDEICLWGETVAWIVENGQAEPMTWTPESFELEPCRVEELTVSSPEESATLIRGIFGGDKGGPTNMVLANTAAALWLTGRCATVAEGTQQARSVLESRGAAQKLQQLVDLSQKLAKQS
ncbi:Anthranilate phosphoribosyltransferase [Polystyrenella longa]|uniref:Anthranilate phosphoribosyltransferase n=1 Tax=Polystyrenella longa TaxID=2528007 RepID=A0A518CNS1_9PLAN|nr:anthranilate phosphoribosyltransferase [Polystyrenella longa]QDU80872.1 Anthranilate phosphoribosyltransferase [Polystyrenella longa]